MRITRYLKSDRNFFYHNRPLDMKIKYKYIYNLKSDNANLIFVHIIAKVLMEILY